MKLYIQKTANGSLETIDVKDDPLGKGGQGAVYNIITSQYAAEYCIKIYLRDAQKSFEKIKYMVSHPPQNIKDNPSFRICWPVALVYDTSKKFVGYMMPLAFPKGHDLTILSVYRNKPLSQIKRFKNKTEWHDKYELDTKEGIINRIKMLCNVAIAIHKIHDTGRYVLVDLKPENIDATGTGKVSIMDTDSIQISENGRILHPATAFTPDYFAPEGKDLKKCNRPFPIQCDNFAAAVCFYQILTGTHPYSGTVLKPPYDKYTELADCIAQGLFAFGEKARYISLPAGFNLQQNFFNLPVEVQQMFKRAFGTNPAMRPSMEEWGKVFYTIIKKGVNVNASAVKRVSNDSPIKIISVEYGDTDKNGNVIRNFGSKLYTDVSYLNPKLSYEVLNLAGSIELRYRITNPKGEVITSDKTIATVSANSKGKCTQAIGGWGNPNKTAYDVPGTYNIEFYFKNKCIFKDTFTIYALGSSRAVTPPKSVPSSAPFQITKMTFLDVKKDNSVIRDEGSTLYTDVMYLRPKIYFNVNRVGPKRTDVWVKITDPNGKVTSNSTIKSGLYSSEIDLSTSGSFSCLLSGWGNDSCNLYSIPGNWKVEIYYQNSCIYSTYVTINRKSSTSSSYTPKPTPKPAPKPAPKPHYSPRSGSSSEGLWSKLNRMVTSIGDKIENLIDELSEGDFITVATFVIGGLLLLFLAAMTNSWFWGIVVFVIGCCIGVYALTFIAGILTFVILIPAYAIRYAFYNIYTLIVALALLLGSSAIPSVVELVKDSAQEKTSITTSSRETTTYVCTSKDVLNVRSKPNTGASVVSTLSPNQAVEVYFIRDGWAKVKLKNNTTGYASAMYLEKYRP